MKKIKKIFVTPLFLLWVLIPALFVDDINLQDIIFPSVLKTDEFTPDSSVNETLIPFVNLSHRQEFSKTNSASFVAQKVFFDEDSPYLPISIGKVKIKTKIETQSVKDRLTSVINYSPIYIMNSSLII